MNAFVAFLRARAENVAAGLLAAMFATFIIQIVARYVVLRFFPSVNIGWTVEMCLTLWLWTVFWTGAFCLNDSDHVKFDMLYQAVTMRTRRIFALVSALAILVGIGGALPATLDYITFYKIKRSATMGIRLDYVFSIYGVFAAALLARYAWRFWHILRGGAPDNDDPGHDTLIGGEEVHPQ